MRGGNRNWEGDVAGAFEVIGEAETNLLFDRFPNRGVPLPKTHLRRTADDANMVAV